MFFYTGSWNKAFVLSVQLCGVGLTFLWPGGFGVSSLSFFPFLPFFPLLPAAYLLLSHLEEEDPFLLFTQGLQQLRLHPHVLQDFRQHLVPSLRAWGTAESPAGSLSCGSSFSSVGWLHQSQVPFLLKNVGSGEVLIPDYSVLCQVLLLSVVETLQTLSVKALCERTERERGTEWEISQLNNLTGRTQQASQ